MSGKGDTRRPASVPAATVDENWARTFGRPEEPTNAPLDTSDDLLRLPPEALLYAGKAGYVWSYDGSLTITDPPEEPTDG